MNGEIDNFELLMGHMDFESLKDRYIVHILRRPKDCKSLSNALGSNEAQRLIRTYYIDNIDYLKAKIPAIKGLCNSCNARAYLIVSPKDNFDCLLNLGKKILETIQMQNYSVKPEHLLRQAYCENHKSRRKMWILDLDKDEMVEWRHEKDAKGEKYYRKKWSVKEVKLIVKRHLEKIQRQESKICPRKNSNWLVDQMYEVPTKNGVHIITPPFNLQEAQKKCGMLFEGIKEGVEQKAVGPGEFDHIKHRQVGWLHKDGMTLLYAPNNAQ